MREAHIKTLEFPLLSEFSVSTPCGFDRIGVSPERINSIAILEAVRIPVQNEFFSSDRLQYEAAVERAVGEFGTESSAD
jgi:hypothetical protein